MTEPSCRILVIPSRELSISYQAMLFSKWLRSLRKGNETIKAIQAKAYYQVYHQYVENLLQKPSSITRVAVLSDDSDTVLGFSVSREDVLDYLYVQPEQRGQGLSKALIPEGITTFTHLTKMWIPIWQAKYKEWQFNCFA